MENKFIDFSSRNIKIGYCETSDLPRVLAENRWDTQVGWGELNKRTRFDSVEIKNAPSPPGLVTTTKTTRSHYHHRPTCKSKWRDWTLNFRSNSYWYRKEPPKRYVAFTTTVYLNFLLICKVFCWCLPFATLNQRPENKATHCYSPYRARNLLEYRAGW